MVHCVRTYENTFNISTVARDITIDKLLDENIVIFKRVVDNLPYGILLKHLPSKKKELYSENDRLVDEFLKNPVISETLLENVYIDKGLKKLIEIDAMERNSELYQELYDDIIQVGKFPVPESIN